ncbi:MAG TPA: TIGR00730 family Rossman fold protein [Acidimicrobiia bacterium]|nr:TIGR00730 family Rossman fold protein [Acidimicrobiia bacterium]
MARYDLGDPELDRRIRALVVDAAVDGGIDTDDADLITEMLVTTLKMQRDQPNRADLKLVNSALKELRYSFEVFGRYRDVRKVAVFGSARTPEADPNYQMAVQLARHMTDLAGWMVITGAGPGTMEAANRGAGGAASFGVNIRLPFEAEANPYVDDARLVNFKYFFTRKLVFVKESHAFAMFPGGFGTLDETFEVLTLIQTGKATMHPVVLIEAPGTGYWEEWIDFVQRTLVPQGMISAADLNLFCRVTDVAAAAAEITGFYRNYHSQRYVGDDLVLRMWRAPDAALLDALNTEFGDIVVSGDIAVVPPAEAERADDDAVELARIRLRFDRRRHGRLRQLVDRLNEIDPGGPGSGA